MAENENRDDAFDEFLDRAEEDYETEDDDILADVESDEEPY